MDLNDRCKTISRRSIVAGIAALCVHGFTRKVRAAETRPLAERLATYAAALRYGDLDAATIERVKSHVIDTLGCRHRRRRAARARLP